MPETSSKCFRRHKTTRMKTMYRMTQNRSAIFSALFSIAIVALGGFLLFEGCGKLSDDTGHSSSPVGTSGGTAIPYGPRASMGTYTLSISANPTSIPADQTNFSTITVNLKNTSGLPTLGYTISFTADGESADNFGWFYDPVSNKFVNKADSITDQNGTATIRFYGIRSGTSVVKAEVDIDEDGKIDLTVSTSVTLTPSGPPNTAGSYSLKLAAYPSTIPADMATYSTISATLTDSAGGSVENFQITFESELGYVNNTPVPTNTTYDSNGRSTAVCLTTKEGKCSIYYYGDRAGSAVITAYVTIGDLVSRLETRTLVTVTEGPGEPGNDVPGIMLIAVPESQYKKADPTTGTATTDPVTVTASVWDSTGDPVGAGTFVEFTGDLEGFGYTDKKGQVELVYPSRTLASGAYIYSITGCTYGIRPQVTQYCDDVTFSVFVDVTSGDLDVTVKAAPEPITVKKKTVVTVLVKFGGKPQSGASVTFQTSGLLTPTTATATTNSSGLAQMEFTAGSREGSETVYVSVETTINGIQVFDNGDVQVTIAAATTTTTTTKSTTTTTTTTTTTKP